VWCPICRSPQSHRGERWLHDRQVRPESAPWPHTMYLGQSYLQFLVFTEGCTKPPPDTTSFTSHWTPANTENPGKETRTYTHYFINFHSVSLVLHKSPFKIANRKSQLNHNSMMSGLCSLLITEWDQLWIQGLAPLPELQGQGWAGLNGQNEVLFACLLTI
jgi:hypothetical protein